MKATFDIVKSTIVTCLCLLILQSSIAQTTKQEILWDNYGVPHIYAKTTTGMYYAYGWAQMHNHANLVLRLYCAARGRSAEIWGKQYLNNDENVHRFNLAKVSQGIYERQHPEYRSYLEAFVNGMNAYAKANPGAINEECKKILPITAQDVIAHTINVISLTFVAGDNIYASKRNASAGSNAMAIAASRSASKHAMLMANPHLPWFGLFTFFEAHLNAPGFNAYGATLLGFPVMAIAFNNNLGWTHTVNTLDASTRYLLTLKDDGYLLDGAVVPFEKRTVTLKIKQDDGTMKAETLICKTSKQGPVVAEKNGKAYAVRVAGIDNPYFNEQYHKMAKASNLAEFESAEKMLQMPMFNTIYADKGGNIMYLFGGDVPVKSGDDFWFWHNRVDGTSSKYIWTKFLSYDQLPKVINPPTGFVQNANDMPWTCTYPTVLDPLKYPLYITPYKTFMSDFRDQRAFNMIKDNHSVTFDQLIGYKLNTGLETADRFLDELISAADTSKDTLVVKATAVLKAWDRHTDTSSRGAVLYANWFNHVDRNSVIKNPWKLSEPATTPNGIRNPAYVVARLKQAAREMMLLYGRLDVPWGEAFRFRSGKIDLPANGGWSYMGSYRAISYYFDKDRKFVAEGGDSYVAVTEFGKQPKAMVSLSYGNATQPGSKHIGDQLKLMSEKKLRPALLDKTAILKNLEEKEELSYK